MSNYKGVATDSQYVLTQKLTPAAVSANTTAEQLFTVNGIGAGDAVYVDKPSLQAGLGVVNVRVVAANSIAITYGNFTASPITPSSETYVIGGIRP